MCHEDLQAVPLLTAEMGDALGYGEYSVAGHFGKLKDKLINLSSPFKSQNRVSLPSSAELQFCGSSSTLNWWFQKYLRVSVVFTLVSHGG